MTAHTFAERLDAARGLLARRDQLRARIPGHLADQAGAATSEAADSLRDIGAARHLVDPHRFPDRDIHQIGTPTRDQEALLLAGVLACTACVHLRAQGPQPAFATLPTRRTSCRRCLATIRRPVVPDDACDICEAPAEGGTFWPVSIQYGALVVLGDACRPCARTLGLTRERTP